MVAVADEPGTVFGARLRALREERELTQAELGELAGMAYQAVARLERGDREPSWQTARRLAKALGVSLDAFGE